MTEERSASSVRSPESGVAPSQPAATVALLRRGNGAPEILFLKRTRRAAFMPRIHVFPGGRVDPGDGVLARREGLVERMAAPRQAEGPFAVDAEREAAGMMAAVRECFEEGGVWLAGEPGAPAPADSERRALHAGEKSFVELLDERRETILDERLAWFAHWVTPEAEPIRFDALTYACVVREGVEASCDESETVAQCWRTAEQALEEHAAGALDLAPPTWMVLREMCGVGDADDMFAWAREQRPLPQMPEIISHEGGMRLLLKTLRDGSWSEDGWIVWGEKGWELRD